MEQNQTQLVRPEKVWWATMFLYLYVTITSTQFLVALPFTTGMMEVIENAKPIGVVTISFILGLLLSIGLIHMVWKGHNWARITLLVFFLPALLHFVETMMQNFAAVVGSLGFIFGVFGVPELSKIVLYCIAIVFLFQKPSSEWFKQVKLEKTRKALSP